MKQRVRDYKDSIKELKAEIRELECYRKRKLKRYEVWLTRHEDNHFLKRLEEQEKNGC